MSEERKSLNPWLWFQELIGGGDQRIHAWTIFWCGQSLTVSFLAFTFASILTRVSYIAEISLLVTAITGLAGYTYSRGKKSEDRKDVIEAEEVKP
jgi:hypothetical protein